MSVLAVYDIAGIQNYIFASNKLAENVGGSKLVKDIFAKVLPDAIHSVTGQDLPKWRDGDKLNSMLSAEIIYEGGGNAFVAFRDEPTFQAVTKRFLIEVSKNAPGIGIAVAAIETDFGGTYKSDFDKLGKRLARVKGGFNTPTFAGNQPITKQSTRTGLPVSEYGDGEYLSAAQVKKRGRYAIHKSEQKSGIEDFSDLAFDKGSDSLIAIIHADGNNMGSRIKAFMESFETYAKAVPAIRDLAVKIDNCYKAARERTLKAFETEYASFIDKQNKEFPNKMFHTEQPILELIGDGDDTTLVIGGRFALDFAVRLLREIEATPIEERPFADSIPTACGGVILFHDHYPFSEAYKLAEELCASAKKLSREVEGSYIDFHLHQSGNVSGLLELRKRQYTVDGKSILCRPWCVSQGESRIAPTFQWIEDNIESFKKMPRNKTKALRNAMGAGETAANIAVNQMRDIELPALPKADKQKSKSKYAPYFDILEFCDAYENLLNKEVAGNA
jgi:hypothetical protein